MAWVGLTIDTDPASGTGVAALATEDGNGRLGGNALPATAFLDSTGPVVANDLAGVGVLSNALRSSDNRLGRTSDVTGGDGESASSETKDN